MISCALNWKLCKWKFQCWVLQPHKCPGQAQVWQTLTLSVRPVAVCCPSVSIWLGTWTCDLFKHRECAQHFISIANPNRPKLVRPLTFFEHRVNEYLGIAERTHASQLPANILRFTYPLPAPLLSFQSTAYRFFSWPTEFVMLNLEYFVNEIHLTHTCFIKFEVSYSRQMRKRSGKA